MRGWGKEEKDREKCYLHHGAAVRINSGDECKNFGTGAGDKELGEKKKASYS